MAKKKIPKKKEGEEKGPPVPEFLKHRKRKRRPADDKGQQFRISLKFLEKVERVRLQVAKEMDIEDYIIDRLDPILDQEWAAWADSMGLQNKPDAE